MKTITYVIILIILCQFSLSAHEEFYKRTSPGSCALAIAYRNYHSCDMLSWSSYSYIGITPNWIDDFPIFELNQTQAITQFVGVINAWNTAATWNVFSIQSAWENYSRIRFINSTTIFPIVQITYGGTYLKYEKINDCEQIVVSSVYCPNDGSHTTVFLNNTTGKGFMWRQDNYIPSIEWADFQFTASHELGHVLGMAHCIYEYPNTIMHAVPPFGSFIDPAPKIHDLTALNILQSPVGIEDWINITLTRTFYNVDQTYVGTNSREFIDEWPYGDEIEEWGPWWITALTGCEEVLVYETEYDGLIHIPPLPDGYDWLRDENDYVLAIIRTSGIDTDGYYHEGSAEMQISNVPNNFIKSGTLTSNTNWRGCVVITGNITVPAGITLTINPNANIIFQNNASLIVNGTLNATSCELSGGLSTWGSVTFDGSAASNSVLNNVLVKNGAGIRCLNSANVIIQNSLLDHCTEGVYFYNSQPQIVNNGIIEPVQNGINGDASGMSLEILHNTITKSPSNPTYKNNQGIILGNYTNGYIAHNDISGFYWGIYIGGGSDAYLTDNQYQTFDLNNRFRDNRVGIGAGWGGSIFGSPFKPAYGYYNSIYNNSVYDAKSYQYSNIYARYNWWGTDGAQIYVDGTSNLDASYPLSEVTPKF